MNETEFREVTDLLGLSAAQLAAALRVPVQSVRQMRSDPDSLAWRPPPIGWEKVVGSLARERALRLLKTANDLLRRET